MIAAGDQAMPENIDVLISHAHDEKELALAWKKLIGLTSGGLVRVWLSSDVSPGGGMDLGKEWQTELYAKLADAEFVIAILSPKSVERPWILWECGAASGVNKERGIVPIVHNMSVSELTGPLARYPAYSGDERERVKEVCARFAEKAGLKPFTVSTPSGPQSSRPRRFCRRSRAPSRLGQADMTPSYRAHFRHNPGSNSVPVAREG